MKHLKKLHLIWYVPTVIILVILEKIFFSAFDGTHKLLDFIRKYEQ